MPIKGQNPQSASSCVLFAIFNEGIRKASRLDLAEHSIGIRLDRKRAKLDTVVFLRCGCLDGRGRSKPRFYIGTEGVHRFAVLREPVHHITVIAGDPEFITLTMANDILFRQPILLAKMHAKFDCFSIYFIEIGCISQAILTNFK